MAVALPLPCCFGSTCGRCPEGQRKFFTPSCLASAQSGPWAALVPDHMLLDSARGGHMAGPWAAPSKAWCRLRAGSARLFFWLLP